MTQVTTMEKQDEWQQRERLSALADGELGGDEFAQLMAAAATDAHRVDTTWQTYHLIGDVLRGGEQSAARMSDGFLARLQDRLAAEPPLVAERPVAASGAIASAPVRVPATEPANDASFRWKMVAGCASFAAVAVMAWSVMGASAPTGSSAPQLAAAPEPTPVVQASAALPEASGFVERQIPGLDGEVQVMIRDARLDELVAAHKQAGGSSALLQMPSPSGYLRSATYTPPDQ